MHALKLFDLIELKTAVVMFKAYNTMLPVNLQKLFVRVEPIRRTRHVNRFERKYRLFELNLNQCLYQIMGLNCGMVLTANLKVVIMYRYSRNVLNNSICKLMIWISGSYKLCERCREPKGLPGMTLLYIGPYRYTKVIKTIIIIMAWVRTSPIWIFSQSYYFVTCVMVICLIGLLMML